MGKKKGKSSRKGKKEWRANISTEDTENYFIKHGQEERTGGPLDELPDESLFFVDKSKGSGAEIQKKTEKNRGKVLHADSLLQRHSLIPPMRAPLKRRTKLKDRDLAKPQKRKSDVMPIIQEIAEENKAEFWDMWADQDSTLNGAKRTHLKGARKDDAKSVALEVDAPGCSYNPRFDCHQEVLGEAVAEEMRKIYKRELAPEPIPRFVEGHAVDEEDVFFLDADDGDEELEEALDDTDAPEFASRTVRVKKLTRAELNKKARKRENQRQESTKKDLLRIKKDVLRLPEIMKDISAEEQDRETRRIRRKLVRAERRARGPPRLGRHKFKPEPAQVLLSDEVTGSLRKLKPCFNLLRDRFKSLQRNGIIEPRVPVRRRESKKRVTYEPGSKGQKEREMHAATQLDRAARKEGVPIIPLQ